MTIDIFFYYKPKIPNNPKHNINFLDEDDKYNPFSTCNTYASCKNITQDEINLDFSSFIYKNIIHNDLDISQHRIMVDSCKIMNSHEFKCLLLKFIENMMQQHNIWFYVFPDESSQSIFIKTCIMLEHDIIQVFS